MALAMVRAQARGLNRDQRNAFLAAWLGWAMDAFDYFLLVFVISDESRASGRFTREPAREEIGVEGRRVRE